MKKVSLYFTGIMKNNLTQGKLTQFKTMLILLKNVINLQVIFPFPFLKI